MLFFSRRIWCNEISYYIIFFSLSKEMLRNNKSQRDFLKKALCVHLYKQYVCTIREKIDDNKKKDKWCFENGSICFR